MKVFGREFRGWWPHFLWADDLHGVPLEQFAPLRYDPNRLFPPLVFKGHVKGCDDPSGCKHIEHEGGCKFCFRKKGD